MQSSYKIILCELLVTWNHLSASEPRFPMVLMTSADALTKLEIELAELTKPSSKLGELTKPSSKLEELTKLNDQHILVV